MHSSDKVDENIAKIGNLFPNCITEMLDEDGKPTKAIDFEMLKQELSKVVVDGPKERYQFTWPDKKKSILLANSPISATLRPCRAESLNFDATENLYIEGDNLDVLKLLQETYLGKVKMIYIDPPYNTGNDFVYEDNFDIDSDFYKELSGDYDDQGNRLRKNNDANGRFHTDWLNMIYPRLKLARDLLRDDGFLFISIGEEEIDNMIKIGNEIFGASMHLGTVIWKRRQMVDSRSKNGLSQDHEYMVIYAKQYNQRIRGQETDLTKYSNPDKDIRGDWMSADMTGLATASQRPNLHYDLVNPDTGIVYICPPTGWRYEKKRMQSFIENNEILFPANKDGRPRRKKFVKDLQNEYAGLSSILNTVYNTQATRELKNLFNGEDYFDFPKPVDLIKLVVQQGANDGYILDFFSGSATTAHAVMQLNAEDGGKRKFIMVQIPEATDEASEAFKAGYKNICEIGKERIRRAGKKVKEEAGLNGQNLDIGFRVLKLDSSNMKNVYYSPETYVNDPTLFDQVHDNIKEDRSGEDLLFQVMLDLGIELSADIRTEKISGKNIYSVKDNYLIACFDNDVNDELLTQIAKRKPFYAVLRDSSFTRDDTASNFEQIFATWSPETIKKVL